MSTSLSLFTKRPLRESTDAGSARAPKSGSRASSERTRLVILHAAKRVLATDGYARFTMRRVASAAGLTVGNLAYHYPSKRELVHALITSLIGEYREQVLTYLNHATGGASKGLGALVDWMIRDSVSVQTSRLFRELWTIAMHDEIIAAAVDRFYAEVHATAAERLRDNLPHLSAKGARGLVQLMGIISEGSNVLYAKTQQPFAPLNDVARLASELLEQAANQRGAASRRKRAPRR